jgi:hypothetical protein
VLSARLAFLPRLWPVLHGKPPCGALADTVFPLFPSSPAQRTYYTLVHWTYHVLLGACAFGLFLVDVATSSVSRYFVQQENRITEPPDYRLIITPSIFPPEIWYKIFVLACVDGGQTGCALSLVSRYIRELSMGTRLQSVAVYGHLGLKHLLRTLHHTREDSRRVRFLFVGYSSHDIAFFKRNPYQRSSPSFLSRLNFLAAPKRDECAEMQAIYDQIITLVAPYLESLTLFLPRISRIIPATVHLPRLLDLTSLEGPAHGDPPPLPCPRLRRLHVSLISEQGLLQWMEGTPELENLRVWISCYDPECLPRTIGSLMGLDVRTTTNYNTFTFNSATQPKHIQYPRVSKLRYLVVKPYPLYYPTYTVDWDAQLPKRMRLPSLNGDNDKRQIVDLVILPWLGEWSQENAIRDWEQVVEGSGDGAWEVIC